MTSCPWIPWPVIKEFKMPLWRQQREPQKALVMISKTTTLHVPQPFLYISLLSLHDYIYDENLPNFTFYQQHTFEHTRTNRSCSF